MSHKRVWSPKRVYNPEQTVREEGKFQKYKGGKVYV
jgi:hypothetical protein